MDLSLTGATLLVSPKTCHYRPWADSAGVRPWPRRRAGDEARAPSGPADASSTLPVVHGHLRSHERGFHDRTDHPHPHPGPQALEVNPEIATDEFSAEIQGMIIDAVAMEEAYNRDLLPKGILGLNADYINTYVKYLADRRLEELGFEPVYGVANPAKWMATANDTLQLVNFFESINTSYEVDARAH